MSNAITTIKSSGLYRALNAHRSLTEEDLQRHSQTPLDGMTVANWLVTTGLASSKDMAKVVADHFGFPLLDLSQVDVDAVAEKEPNLLQAAKGLDVFLLGSRNGTLFAAVADPTDLSVLQQLKFRTQMQVEPIVVEQHKLANLTQQAMNNQGGVDLLTEDIDGLNAGLSEEELGVDDAPIVRFVHRALQEAIRLGASDIHLEPYETQYRIRYRIDGVLQETAHPPVTAKSKIAARIKIMSKLNTTETRIPQEGRLQVTGLGGKNRKVDFRVSTLPTLHGEKIVLRILNSNQTILKLDKLGLNQKQMDDIKAALELPHGMILVTGPTGSGKTVTLYTFLSMLNNPSINISTVEDPAEINLPGVNQVNINEKIDLTFSRTLRALLRQDPDVIMVGEIRDSDTADISIKASQTGHLVLSTLHTNDAVSSIVRLKNMGVELFNIAGSLNMVIAQRLVRQLCSCKAPHPKGIQAMVMAGLMRNDETTQVDWTPFCAVGCDACNGTGYEGRTGIYEVMKVSEAMRNLILEDAPAKVFEQTARDEGVISMRQAGINKVREGITSIEEILGATTTD